MGAVHGHGFKNPHGDSCRTHGNRPGWTQDAGSRLHSEEQGRSEACVGGLPEKKKQGEADPLIQKDLSDSPVLKESLIPVKTGPV